MKRTVVNAKALLIGLLLTAMPILSQAQHMPNHKGHESEDHAHHMHEDHTIASYDLSINANKAGLTRTAEIETALANGGEPVVVDVLGVVCDFCAKAMDKTFGKRAEVAAVYVDLDAKTLNLVMKAGETLSNSQIDTLVERAGYKLAAIRRGDDALNTGR